MAGCWTRRCVLQQPPSLVAPNEYLYHLEERCLQVRLFPFCCLPRDDNPTPDLETTPPHPTSPGQHGPAVSSSHLRPTQPLRERGPDHLQPHSNVGTSQRTYLAKWVYLHHHHESDLRVWGTSYVLPFNAATAQITGLPPATLVTTPWHEPVQATVTSGNFVTTRTVTFTTASPLATRAAGSSGVSVHPNPTTDRFTLTLATPLPSAGTLVLTDVVGRPVRQQALAVGTRTLVVEVAGLMPGVYVLRCGSAASSVVVE
jgi:hypothetical protein